jgi:hypothetical protein
MAACGRKDVSQLAYRDRLYARVALQPQRQATQRLVRANRVAATQRVLASAQHRQVRGALAKHLQGVAVTRAAAAPPRLKRIALAGAYRPAGFMRRAGVMRGFR